MKMAPVKSDVGMSKSSVVVGKEYEAEFPCGTKFQHEMKPIQVGDETFKSNLNIIDLNAGKNLGFKPDGSYLYCIIKMKLLVNIIHVLFSCSL